MGEEGLKPAFFWGWVKKVGGELFGRRVGINCGLIPWALIWGGINFQREGGICIWRGWPHKDLFFPEIILGLRGGTPFGVGLLPNSLGPYFFLPEGALGWGTLFFGGFWAGGPHNFGWGVHLYIGFLVGRTPFLIGWEFGRKLLWFRGRLWKAVGKTGGICGDLVFGLGNGVPISLGKRGCWGGSQYGPPGGSKNTSGAM